MLTNESAEYMHFFVAFAFDEASLRVMLESAKRDLYMGIWWSDRLVGIFMLRGWDAGYEVPSYGAMIAEHMSGKGLATIAIEVAKSICRIQQVRRMMLKI